MSVIFVHICPLNEIPVTHGHSVTVFPFFMFQVTAKFAIMFITVQYNVTQVLGESTFYV